MSLGRWIRRRLTPLIVAVAALVSVAAVHFSGSVTPVDGLLFDAGVAVRWWLNGGKGDDARHVAVIAIDRSTLDAEELKVLPRALFSPVWGQTLEAAAGADALSVTFDAIFEFSGNAVIANHDRPFLAALAKNKARAVIARTGETVPALPFMFAIGGRNDPFAVALSELVSGMDGVVREARPYFLDPQGNKVPTLSAAALVKAGHAAPEAPTLYRTDQPLELAVPTYPLIDVLRCAATPEGRDVLRRHLGGRAVFVGTTLPEEDRKITADRLILPFMGESHAQPVDQAGDTCGLSRLGVSSPRSGTIPGVFVHAAVVESVMSGQGLRQVADWQTEALAALAAGLVALAGLVLSPLRAVAVALVLSLAAVMLSWLMAPMGWWLPPGPALEAAIASATLAFAARYWFEERRRAHLQKVFGHYLAPVIVEQLAESEEGPKLQGETRDATIMFADLSGFTALSGILPPDQLMEITNRYLSVIVQAVDDTGGYVDKFIGDAVMALWNAPAPCPNHAEAATRGAVQAAAAVRALADAADARGDHSFKVKIGLNSGPVTAGNVGAVNRFSYTAVGETVNIASRLEPLPALYGCAVVVSGDTARQVGDAWVMVEIDWVRVKGRQAPVEVLVPLAPKAAAAGAVLAPFVDGFAAALADYRRGDFAAAARRWRDLPAPAGWCGDFGPTRVMADRAELLAAAPPVEWSGVWTVAKG